MKLAEKIEGILYYKGQPVSIKELINITGANKDEVAEAIETLHTSLDARGLSLVVGEDEVELCTDAELADILARLQKEDLEKPLSKASVETLTIVAYSDGILRSQIDYIRGVNSNFILRSLEMRGLVEKKPHPEDKRSMLYYPTIDFLKSLGVDTVDALPDYEAFREKIASVENEQEEQNEESHES